MCLTVGRGWGVWEGEKVCVCACVCMSEVGGPRVPGVCESLELGVVAATGASPAQSHSHNSHSPAPVAG